MMQWKTGVAVIILVAGAALAGCGAGAGDSQQGTAAVEGAELATAQFSVEGMTCGGCVLAAEMAVKRVDGVRSVAAHFDEDTHEGRATVEYDPEVAGTEAIAAAIRKAGFTPSLEGGAQDGPEA